jgi:transposase
MDPANITLAPHGDVVTIRASLELSLRTWLVGIGRSDHLRVSRHNVEGGDLAGLVRLFRHVQSGEEKRLCRQVRLIVCFEAGRDGHWLYRALTAEGFEVFEIDAGSIEVSRRKRRAKTDRLDVEKLDSVLARLDRGETDAARVVHVPSVVEEDARQLNRELERLGKESTAHSNRMKALLFSRGIRDFEPMRQDRLATLRTWNGEPLPPRLMHELVREYRRLALLQEQLAEVEAERDKLLDPSQSAPETVAMRDKMQRLTRLVSFGPAFSTRLVGEVYYRTFNNRRQVGSFVGLVGCPYDSGETRREQGISKAGNRRARTTLIEAAWLWTRFQPDSALSQWFRRRVGDQKGRIKRIAIVAVARKLAVALWRYLETGLIPEGAKLKAN